MRLPVVLTSLLFLAACPDPTASEGQLPGAPGEPMGGPGGGPGGGGPNGRPEPAGFGIESGAGVKISGAITYAGTSKGTIYYDVLSKGQDNMPALVYSGKLDAPGPFEFEAKKDFGEVYVVAFLDVNGSGSSPEPTEPAGRVAGTVDIGSEPVSDLTIALSDTPDLGDLTPSSKPTGGGPGGAQGGPPPGGAQGGPPSGGAQGGPPSGGAQGGPPPGGAQGGPPPGGAQGGPPPGAQPPAQ
jgi:hypothetical protein